MQVIQSADFTLKGYHEMLSIALDQKYVFRSFHEKGADISDYVCLLRHDIDADLGAAFSLAEVEASLGVKATYFLMVRSPLYNLFSRANHSLVRKIISLGHDIGLHFDDLFATELGGNRDDQVRREAMMLEEMFGAPIHTVSFHQPGPYVIKGDLKVEGFINTYNHEDMRGFHYISDSNMVWKDRSATELFLSKQNSKIHLLIHPMWWNQTQKRLPTEKLWEEAIINNFNRSQNQLLETERAYGRKRVMRLETDEAE